MTDTDNTDDESKLTRRGIVAGALAATGLSMFSAGRATAQTTGSGTVGPYETVTVTDVEFIPVSSAPASETDTATLYWRS